jgi:glycosyltransferase involved in cell wall biosynthesis
MNIAILGLTATSHGSLTYLQNFLPRLAELDRANRYEVFLPAAQADRLDVRQANFRMHVPRGAPPGGTRRVLWEQLILPAILHARHVDLIYTTHNMAILFSAARSIILVQNVEPFFAGQFPNAPHLRLRLWLLRRMTEISLRRSFAIVAISEWEKEFLVERFHLPAEKITVCYPGVTEGFAPQAPGSVAALREQFGIEPPYLLAVTRLAGYGNLLNLVKAYTLLVREGKVDMPLVVPGEVWDKRYIGQVKRLLAAEGCAERVRFLGYVPHPQMPLLFGHATCFVFPSLLEACGMVLIEALACGTPILCCQRRPMTDICGDAADYFDGQDHRQIADKISVMLSDAARREALSQRARERARRFSWREGARKVLQVFQQAGAAGAVAECIPPEGGG